ncbi:MAG TPA: hypothetical protein VIK52_05620 [Opitutaceae bacterium]
MNFKTTNHLLGSGALLGMLVLGVPAAVAADGEVPGNVLEIAGGGGWVKGDDAAYAKRYQLNRDGFGGIERLLYSATGESGTVTVEGRALAGNNDYLFKLLFVNDERGSFEIGYREFRTWYDGTGSVIASGVATGNGHAVVELFDDMLTIDRSQFWMDGLFKSGEHFKFHLRYTHNERDGQKDSTSHADTTFTGGKGTRRVVASFYDIDEKQDLVEFDATYTAGQWEAVGALRWDNREVNNSRNMRRRALEAGQDRSISHIETNDSDLFNARGYLRQEYNDKLTFNAAYSHTKVDTVLGGSRVVGTEYYSEWNPTFATRQQRDEGFFDLTGESETKLDVWNLNVVYTPTETFTVVPSFRVERESREVVSEFVETNFSAAKVAIVEEIEVLGDRNWDEWTAQVEARYTGLKNWVFIGRALWTEGDGELAEDRIEVELDHSLISRDSMISKWTEKYALTANWYPAPKVNFSFIYSWWNRYTDYDTLSTSVNNSLTSGDRYPAFIKSLDLTTNDFAARMTLRAASNVTLVSRVDLQKTELDANQIGLNLIEAGKYDTMVLSQSVNWNPSSRVFVQGMINYVEDTLHTPANDTTGAGANLVLEQVSDYWSANINVGIAVDEQDDLLFNYDHFFAGNFVDNSTVSVPYGLDRKDHSFGATWVRRINDRTKISLRYAYAKNKEASSAGLNDFEANLLYGKLEYRF